MKHRDQFGAFMLPRDMQGKDRLLRHILSPSICCRRAYTVADDNVSTFTAHTVGSRQSKIINSETMMKMMIS